RRVGEPGMGQGARRQSLEQPHPSVHAARCRLARGVPSALSKVSGPEGLKMPANTDPCFLPVHRLAADIAARRLSPVDVVEAFLARIAAHEPKLHAYVDVYADDARLAAEGADKAIRAGHAAGPLPGVPIALED